jgi:GNAT superfamily N-acetyltransferase
MTSQRFTHDCASRVAAATRCVDEEFPMSTVYISPSRAEELDQILVLLHQLWPDWRADEERVRRAFLKGIRSRAQVYLSARVDGEVIGFASLTIKNSLWLDGCPAHTDEMIVHEDFRGQGVGSLLLEELVKVAKRHSCTCIELDSGFHRTQAHDFYRSRGFESRGLVFSKGL